MRNKVFYLLISVGIGVTFISNAHCAEKIFEDNFKDDNSKARFFIEAEDYSARTSSDKGEWVQVNGTTNLFADGPEKNKKAPLQKGSINGDYMIALGSNIGNVAPIDTSYDGPFLDYKVHVKDKGSYELLVRWSGQDGNTDSFYAFLVAPDNSLLSNSGPDYFLYHGRTSFDWSNEGRENTTKARGFYDSPKWRISKPGVYTIRLALREAKTSIDTLLLLESGCIL